MKCSKCDCYIAMYTCVGMRYVCSVTGKGLNSSVDIDPDCPKIAQDIVDLREYCRINTKIKPRKILRLYDNDGEILSEVFELNGNYFIVKDNGNTVIPTDKEGLNEVIMNFNVQHYWID